jgi:hypothetical protein
MYLFTNVFSLYRRARRYPKQGHTQLELCNDTRDTFTFPPHIGVCEFSVFIGDIL